MRFARPRIRTLLVAVVSTATGLAAAPSFLDYILGYPSRRMASELMGHPAPTSELILAAALVIGVGTHVAILVLLALLPRMTTRRWMVAVALFAALLAVKAHLSRVAEQYRAIAKRHDEQSFLLAHGKHWSGPLDGHCHISIDYTGSGHADGEELKGRDLARVLWHIRLAEKYESAALRPWRPVPPDPPEPK
jgi:hypothetical protein